MRKSFNRLGAIVEQEMECELLTGDLLAQQLKNATPFEVGPKFIIRDRDAGFGAKIGARGRGRG